MPSATVKTTVPSAKRRSRGFMGTAIRNTITAPTAGRRWTRLAAPPMEENEMELIDKVPLYNELSKLEELARNRVIDTPSSSPAYARYSAQLTERTQLKRLIADATTIEASPMRRGRWTWYEKQNGNPLTGYDYDWGWECSACQTTLPDDFDNPDERPQIKFCPYCGAKMDKEEG